MVYPTNYKTIMKLQQKDKRLLETAKKNNHFKNKKFEGVEKIYCLICFNDKIAILKDLQKRMVQWYHTTLNYLGESRIELTISHTSTGRAYTIQCTAFVLNAKSVSA